MSEEIEKKNGKLRGNHLPGAPGEGPAGPAHLPSLSSSPGRGTHSCVAGMPWPPAAACLPGGLLEAPHTLSSRPGTPSSIPLPPEPRPPPPSPCSLSKEETAEAQRRARVAIDVE